MRADLFVWILFFLFASVFAQPTIDNSTQYSIEIKLNGFTKVYHDNCVEINYNTKDTVKITFIKSGYDYPFMKTYWIKDGERVRAGTIVHNFRSQLNLTLNSDDDDCRLLCEIWLHDIKQHTLEVHFLQNINPKGRNMSFGSLFKIILICLGAFIGISILIMILIAVYRYFKNKSSPSFNNTTYPDYSERIPMNYSIPKNIKDNQLESDK